jgi:hypothetical protein
LGAYAQIVARGGDPAPPNGPTTGVDGQIMPKTMGIVRPDRVLVIGTMDDYMKV